MTTTTAEQAAPKRGRKPTPDHLKRVDVPLRLPAWIRDQIRSMGAPADVIEAALIKAYKLKQPKDSSGV